MTELGEFLRSRRARLTPADAGLSRPGDRRRVPGLRREELAQLAGVSVTYYTRLEQGQSRNASDAVLDSLARVLLLSDDEQAHMRSLARPARAARRSTRPERVRPAILQLIGTMRDVPALVLGRRTDVLAWNRLGHALIASHLDFAAPSQCAIRPNMARLILLDAHTRDLYVHWRRKVEDVVSYLRLASGQHPDDAALTSLIGELCVNSADFASTWARHGVRDCGPGRREFRHPLLGELSLAEDILRLQDDPGQRLVLLTPEPGSTSAERLALLASLHAPARAAGHRVVQVTLLADHDTMIRRIHRRGETSRSYSGRQLERSLDALRAPEFARHLPTDTLSISAVADDIATHAGFTLSPDTSPRLVRQGHQLAVQLRHIRLGA